MTREEFESILEEAFLAGYNDAIDEIFEEDNTFDLEEEMDSYLEARDDTKFDRFRKALVKGLDAPAKELGVSNKTRKSIGKAALAITGRMNPKLKAKAFAKHSSRAAINSVKDSDKVLDNIGKMGADFAMRSYPAEKQVAGSVSKHQIPKKLDIATRILKNKAHKFDTRMGKLFSSMHKGDHRKFNDYNIPGNLDTSKVMRKIHDKKWGK